MKTTRMFYAVCAGIAALGVVLACIGFVLSGLNPQVFTTEIDLGRDGVSFGGVSVEHVEDVPLLSLLGDNVVDTQAAAPAAPAAPARP